MKPLSIVVREDSMVPLDRWLATELSAALGRQVPRGLVRRAIVGGVVTVAGRIVRDPGMVPRRGPSVFIRHFDWLPVAEPALILRVLHEDDAVIAVDKPAGLPTHGNKDADRPSLTGLVERHAGRPVFVHHRLDAGTSGVVLFAKMAEANASLARSFAEREVEKTYVALVARPPIDWPREMTIDTPILVSNNGSVRIDRAGIPAETRLRILERRADSLLLEAKPVTGRKHQIRVHLASVGAPVIGDSRYGGPPAKSRRLMLHAERIELDHPVTGKRLVVSSPRPDEFGEQASPSRSSRSRPPGTDRRPAIGAVPGRRPAEPRSGTNSHKGRPRRKPGGGGGRGSRH